MLYHYPFVNQTFGRPIRKREKIYIQILGNDSREENRDKAEEWARVFYIRTIV